MPTVLPLPRRGAAPQSMTWRRLRKRLTRITSWSKLYYALRRRVVLWYWKRWVRWMVGPVGTVLEIGPGIYPQTWVKGRFYQAIEPYGEYVELLRAQGVAVWRATAQEWAADPFINATDVLIMTDTIEHLPKADGLTVLKAAQKIARAIVVMTPLGYYPYDGGGDMDAWGMQGQSWQTHRSGWTPDDLPGWVVKADPYFHGPDAGAFVAVWQRDGWATKN